MLAIVCPGQGSQTPGMLSPWLELPGVADQLGAFSQLGTFSTSDIDLRALGTDADADAIRDTRVAQPLIVASSLIALRAILDGRDAREVVDITAGHSVGEFAAAATAGVLDDAGAVALVSQRAAFMADAAAANPSGMSAVLGGDPDEVFAAIEAAGLWPANVNGGGQIVAAGSLDNLAAFAENPPAKARIIPLKVAGAFHTPLMDSAAASFAPVAAGWAARDPQIPFLSNADGASYENIQLGEVGRGTVERGAGEPGTVEQAATKQPAAEQSDPAPFGAKATVLTRLAEQITAPVRWDLCQATLAARGVTALLELMPGGVLTGLARRAVPGVETVAVKSPADIEAARDLISRHSGTTIAPAEDSK